jgi:hypothetical protein
MDIAQCGERRIAAMISYARDAVALLLVAPASFPFLEIKFPSFPSNQ